MIVYQMTQANLFQKITNNYIELQKNPLSLYSSKFLYL
jgi:hypothetical protein